MVKDYKMTEVEQVKVYIGNLEITNYDLVEKTDKMKTFVKEDTNTKVSLNVTIKNLEVKYLPTKFDKLVMIPDEDTFGWIEQWESAANEVVKVEKYTKNGAFGCRPSGQLKEKLNKELNEGDFVDVVISYNGISNYQDKWYPSFTLVQFRKVKPVQRKEINYFADD